MKRKLKFNFSDGGSKTINIKKVTSLSKEVKKTCLHLDNIGDNDYLLIVNEGFWDTEKDKLINIELIRED